MDSPPVDSLSSCPQDELVRLAQIPGPLSEEAQSCLISVFEAQIEVTIRARGGNCDYDSRQDAQSAARLALLRAIQKFDFSREVSFKTYACTCISNAVGRALKREARVTSQQVRLADDLAEEDALEDRVLAQLDASERAERHDAAIAATRSFLASLPVQHQHVIRRVFWEGWSQADVARELGVSRNAVHKTLSRVYQRGRSDLQTFHTLVVDE